MTNHTPLLLSYIGLCTEFISLFWSILPWQETFSNYSRFCSLHPFYNSHCYYHQFEVESFHSNYPLLLRDTFHSSSIHLFTLPFSSWTTTITDIIKLLLLQAFAHPVPTTSVQLPTGFYSPSNVFLLCPSISFRSIKIIIIKRVK